MRRVKIGLVGLGYPSRGKTWKAELHAKVPSISWSRYLPQIANNPSADLVAICDRSIDKKSREVQQAYDVTQFYDSYKEMIEEADIDAVVINTPHKLHAQMAIEAAKSGKHVLVEKPLATSLEDAKEVVRAARQNNIKLMALPLMDDGFLAKARELISKGVLGKLCVIRGINSHGGPGHSAWFYRPGGGPIFDLGVYPLSTITALVGPARRVQAFACTTMKERFVKDKRIRVYIEDNAVINLDFGQGLLASIQTNYCTSLEIDSVEIHGNLGSLLLQNDEPGLRMFLREDYHGLRGWFQAQRKDRHAVGRVVDRFLECILADQNIEYMGEHQLHVVEIMEKAKISSLSGKAFEITTRFSAQR